jgi:AcrR family transcriptional regulator
MVPPRQERSEESTQRLLDAATKLLAEVGYAGTTLAAVGARAGYSRSLVTARFGSKEGLLNVLIDRLSLGWAPYFAKPPPAETGLASLVGLVCSIARGVRADPTALRVMQRLIFEASGRTAAASIHRRFRKATATFQHDVAALVRRGVADGSIRSDVDVDAEAAVILATLRGITYEWFLYPTLVDVEKAHETYADQLVRSLSPPSRRITTSGRAPTSRREHRDKRPA